MPHTDHTPLRDLMWYSHRPEMTEKGIPPLPEECQDKGNYSARLKDNATAFGNLGMLNQYPNNWKMPLYQHQNQFVRDNLAALKAGKAFKVTLPDGSTLYVARSGWKRVAYKPSTVGPKGTAGNSGAAR